MVKLINSSYNPGTRNKYMSPNKPGTVPNFLGDENSEEIGQGEADLGGHHHGVHVSPGWVILHGG